MSQPAASPTEPTLSFTGNAVGLRTDYCGELRAPDVGRTVSVCGWVARRREHGEHLAFLDVRDLQKDPIQSLSRRERVMLETLSRGLTNRELSKELNISINTVKFHLSNLFEKLSVRNRAQAIAFYYSSRLPGERMAPDRDEH